MKYKTIIAMSLAIILDATVLVAWRGLGKHVTGLIHDRGTIPVVVVMDGGSGALEFRTPWGGRTMLYHSIHDRKLYWGPENFCPSNPIPLNCESELAEELLRSMRRHSAKYERGAEFLQYWIKSFDEQRENANINLEPISGS